MIPFHQNEKSGFRQFTLLIVCLNTANPSISSLACRARTVDVTGVIVPSEWTLACVSDGSRFRGSYLFGQNQVKNTLPLGRLHDFF